MDAALPSLAPWPAVAVGLTLLVLGGEALVRGAASAARTLGVSPLLIGITLVGFGTSAPELFTSLQAVRSGSPGIGVGAVVGSNVANALLVVGVAALVRPFAVEARAFRRDGAMLVLATAAAIGVALYGRLDRTIGAAFLSVLLIYVGTTWIQERIRRTPDPEAEAQRVARAAEARIAPAPAFGLALALAAAGIGLTLFGARTLVDGAAALARQYGVSDMVVGLTIVALGTSLPELVTSAVAGFRREPDVAFGNVIGSNIYNVFGVLGVTALVRPIAVPPELVHRDIWVLAASAAMLVWFAGRNNRVTRLEGLGLVLVYGGYLAWLALAARQTSGVLIGYMARHERERS